MFATLLLLSTMLLRELGRLTPRTPGQRHCRAAMAAGSLAILLTGIYPEHLERDGDRNLDIAYSAAFALHALGLTAACTLTVAVPFAWMCVARHHLGDRVGARRLLAVRAAHVTLAMAASVAFAAVRAHADVSDYCEPLGGSAAACAAWPTLLPPACAAIQRPTRYRCAYVNNTLSADAERLLPSDYAALHRASCRKDQCTLYVNARSIACEFASLFLICTCAPCAFTSPPLSPCPTRGCPRMTLCAFRSLVSTYQGTRVRIRARVRVRSLVSTHSNPSQNQPPTHPSPLLLPSHGRPKSCLSPYPPCSARLCAASFRGRHSVAFRRSRVLPVVPLLPRLVPARLVRLPAAERPSLCHVCRHRYVAIWGITDARRICERVRPDLGYVASLADGPVLQPLRPQTSAHGQAVVSRVAAAHGVL